MGDYQDLLDFLNELSPNSAEDPDVVAVSLGTYRQRLLQPLSFKGPNPESRGQVDRLKVATQKYGEQALDPEPDRRMVLLLSDELKLDEVLCVEYLIAALEERGSFTCDTAAGMYFEERQTCLRCLSTLLLEVATEQLAQHAESPPPSRHPFGPVLQEFVYGLLTETGPGGKQLLVSRIIELLQDNSLEPQANSSLPNVHDEAGIPVPRSFLLQLERRLLAKSLLYACTIDQRLSPAVTASLFDLLHTLALRLRGTGAKDPFQLEALQLVLLATALVTSPQLERGAAERTQVLAILNDASIKAKVESGDIPQEGYSAVLRLSWGGLLSSAQQSPDEVRRHLAAATTGGAFQALRQVFENAYFQSDTVEHQALVASVVYGRVAMYLMADQSSPRTLGLVSGLLKRNAAAVRRVGNVVTYAAFPPEDPAARHDHAGTVLSVLAAVFTAHPRLWLNHEQLSEHRPPVEAFIATVVLNEVMRASPEVRVPFLDMLGALACNEFGASLVMRQVAEMAKQPALEALTWGKLLAVIVEYCVRYSQMLNELGQMAGRGGSVMVPGGGREEKLMNSYEADILVAFLNLFRRVLEHAQLLEATSFLEQLEREVAPLIGGAPLYEPLVQLMCHPVPNTVKASLDALLAGLMRFKEFQPRLLERLLQCAAVSPATAFNGGGGGVMADGSTANVAPGVPRLDLVTQLNEVEARREEYPETIAFIRLLNHLAEPLRTAGGGGMELGHFTAFVMQHVLGHLWQRSYKDPTQKYELAAVSFSHLELMVELAARSALPAADASARQPPGHHVMHSLLGGGTVLAAVMHVLSPGYEDMTALRTATQQVAPREAAVVAALRLLLAASRLDARFLSDLHRAGIHDRYQPLDSHFRRPRELSCLLEYVCYQDSLDVQVLSIQLGAELVRRIPSLVAVLQGSDFDAGRCAPVRRGYALALKHGLLAADALDNLDEQATALGGSSTAGKHDEADPRAALILQMILDSCSSSDAPSMAHLLMGYDPELVDRGIERSVLMPRAEYSCLTVIERGLLLRDCWLSRSKPKLYEQMLHVMYRLASQPRTDLAMIEFLSPRQSPELVPRLAGVLMQPLPGVEVDDARALAAVLHQNSHTMRMQALLLLRLEHQESIRGLLQQLFAEPPSRLASDPLAAFTALRGQEDEGAQQQQREAALAVGDAGRKAVVELLEGVCSVSLQEPYLSNLGPEERRLMSEMAVCDVSVADLLANPAAQRAMGILVVADTGETLFDMAALYPLLVQRYEQYMLRCGTGADGGGADAPAAAAVRLALQYVQQYNAWVLLSGAQLRAGEALLQLIQIAFTRRYEALGDVLQGGQPEALYELLLVLLEAVRVLLSRSDTSALAPPICQAARVLLAKLQEQAALQTGGSGLTSPSDPLARVRTPARCHQLLRLLLDLLLRSRRTQPVRMQLCSAMLQFLQFCSGARLSAGCTSVALEGLLDGLDDGGQSSDVIAMLDATQSGIESGIAELLVQHGAALVEVLAADALDASGTPPLQQAVALHLLGALVSADLQGAVTVAAYQQNVPQAILQLLTTVPQQVLLQPTKRARRAMYVLEAQLALLLRLVDAGGTGGAEGGGYSLAHARPNKDVRLRGSSAQRMYSINAIQMLDSCRAIDFEPEEPHSALGASTGFLRSRLHHLVSPLLRLLLSLLAALPASSNAKADAVQFVTNHSRLLDRLLTEAAGPGGRDWQPGPTELEQAELAVALLSRLVTVWHQLAPVAAGGLRMALHRLAFSFLCLDTKSPSPIVRSLAAEAAAGTADGRSAWLLRAGRVAALRCSLARYLRDSVAHSRGDEDMLRCVGGGDGRMERDPVTARPTLMLVRYAAEQAVTDAMQSAEELAGLLAVVRSGDPATVAQELRTYAPDAAAAAAVGAASGGGAAATAGAVAGGGGLRSLQRRAALQRLALCASLVDRRLGRSLYVLENALAVLLLHLLRYLPRPFAAGGLSALAAAATGVRTAGGGDQVMEDASASADGLDILVIPEPGPEAAAKLGAAADVAYLLSRLQETCMRVEELLSGDIGAGAGGGVLAQHPTDGIALLVRMLKAYCSAY